VVSKILETALGIELDKFGNLKSALEILLLFSLYFSLLLLVELKNFTSEDGLNVTGIASCLMEVCLSFLAYLKLNNLGIVFWQKDAFGQTVLHVVSKSKVISDQIIFAILTVISKDNIVSEMHRPLVSQDYLFANDGSILRVNV
jgi:hypothetical protein